MTRTCTECDKEFALPLRPGPLAVAMAGIEQRGPICKPCRSKSATGRYLKTEHGRTNRKKLEAHHRDARVEATRQWRKRQGPDVLWAKNQQYAHGLDTEQLAALCAHDPVCAVCGRKTALHTDHNHETKQVRGRLCVRCNTAIGKLGDNLAGVMRAVMYLEERDNVTGLPWQ